MKTSVVYTQFWDVPVWWFDVNIIVGSWKQHSTGAANLVNKQDADCSVDEREETYSTAQCENGGSCLFDVNLPA